MKIILLTSSMGAGGAERVATTLCNAWNARGDQATLIATFSGGGTSFYKTAPGVEVVYLADVVGVRKKSVISYAQRILALRKLIADRRPDAIISFLPNVNVAALIASAGLGIPVIVSERSDPSIYPQPWLWKTACVWSYRFADVLMVQTESVAAKVENIFPGVGVVRAIPNPLPEEVCSISTSPCGSRKVLLSMGRLAPEKQVDKLIDAFAELVPRFAEWDLHIYGDGPLRAELAARIDGHGLVDRIFLQGATQYPWKAMAAADAFAMVSAYEGFPNTLLEAMGVGLPCITFDCPSGPREITRDGKDALLVPLNDHAALVSAMAELMGDAALRTSLGRQARVAVSNRFSLHTVLKAWDNVFREMGVVVIPYTRPSSGIV